MNTKLIKLSMLFVLLLAGYNTASASFTISRPSTHNLDLVGHWTFDGAKVVNGVALDSAGTNNGNLVNIASSTFYSYGKIGQGFNFDGVNDSIKLVNHIAKGQGTQTFSVWVKLNSTTFNEGVGSIFYESTASNFYARIEFVVIDGGTVRFRGRKAAEEPTGNPYGRTSSTNLAINQWYHIVGIWNVETADVSIYINGSDASGSTTGAGSVGAHADTTSFNGTNIGSTGGGTAEMNGIIDDVRVYNRALSAGEIKNLYNQGVSKFNKTPTNILTSDLVGHWTFDGAKVVNGVALDSAGTNNGNLKGIATSTFYSYGKIGQGFNFDGVNDYVVATDNASLSITGNLTISAWIKPVDATVIQSVVSKYDAAGGQRSYMMNISDTSIGCNARELLLAVSSTITPFTGAVKCSNAVLLSNNWAHIVAVYNASAQTIDLYIDGVNQTRAIGTGTIPSSIADSSRNLSIGLSYNNSTTPNDKPFNGNIDDVRVYNRALSAGEIKMLYNMGR